ncbi:MAG: hypothetical protein MHM6MM_007682 [Cercozoa sp. M6MM]
MQSSVAEQATLEDLRARWNCLSEQFFSAEGELDEPTRRHTAEAGRRFAAACVETGGHEVCQEALDACETILEDLEVPSAEIAILAARAAYSRFEYPRAHMFCELAAEFCENLDGEEREQLEHDVSLVRQKVEREAGRLFRRFCVSVLGGLTVLGAGGFTLWRMHKNAVTRRQAAEEAARAAEEAARQAQLQQEQQSFTGRMSNALSSMASSWF